MNEREVSERWKQAILAKLYERQPRPVDVAVDDANATARRQFQTRANCSMPSWMTYDATA